MIIFDKRIWGRQSISNNEDTSWKCGKCGIGSLHLQTKIPNVLFYSIQVKCTHSNCNELYSAVGRVIPLEKGIQMARQYFKIDDFRLYPTHFEPELLLFEIPISLSPEIKSKILLSFNHFWYDFEACANKIRQAIELIVEEKGGIGKTLDKKIKSLKNKLGVEWRFRLM